MPELNQTIVIPFQEHGVNKIFKLEGDRLDAGGNK